MVLNNAGETVFSSILTGSSGGFNDDTGIYRGNVASLVQIAREGQTEPNGNGTFSSLFAPALNDLGRVAFSTSLSGTSGGTSDDRGIYRGNGGLITQIVREGQAAPDGNGIFSNFDTLPTLNNSDQVAFQGFLTGTSGGLSDDRGLYRGSGGVLTQIVRKSQSTPGGNGTFLSFQNPILSNSGDVAFHANLTGTSGGSSDNTGIFIGNGGAIAQIAREGQTAPGGNGTFSSFTNTPVVNGSDQVAFSANLIGTSGGSSDNSGIFRGSGGAITQIAREGQSEPGGNGTFSFFSSPVLNDSGQVAFIADLIGTFGGTNDNAGIFLGDGGAIAQIARKGQAPPDANGTFLFFRSLALNQSGQTAFVAELTGTTGGSTDNTGLYTSDGMDFLQVVREGDPIGNSTVAAIAFQNSSLNDWGQISYLATLANGDQVVNRWTPDLHWRSNTNGQWDTPDNWTLGLNPNVVHDVFIDPDVNLTVTGSASDRAVRSLQIGGGTGQASLFLSGNTLTATEGVTIHANGMLAGNGVIVGNAASAGGISPGASAGSLTFNGSLDLAVDNTLLIDLGGLNMGEFDQILVNGNLSLAGNLSVLLIGGHTLAANQFYMIAAVDGTLAGQFDGLAEGAVVGNFGGAYDLFITYSAGDGNDIGLFTAIPEPGNVLLLGLAALGCSLQRRRKGTPGFAKGHQNFGGHFGR